MSVVHIFDNASHLDVARNALDQAIDYATHHRTTTVISDTVHQLAAWITFTEGDDEPA